MTPLQEVEASVKTEAKARSIDMASPEGPSRLRSLIDEHLRLWDDDHRRGKRPFPISDPEHLAAKAYRNLAGYGPLESLLADDDVWEICINAPDQVFVKRHSRPSGYHDDCFHDEEHVVRTMTRILDDAAGAHRKFDPAEGLQDAQLSTGARLHIAHDDIGRGGHTIVNIRKFTGVAIRSLEELVARSMLDAPAATLLRACVGARASILFAGAPGAGKTTLLSCCAAELDPALRVVIAEEVFETDIALPNVASLQTRSTRGDRQGIDLRRLVAGFLRMAPDVAIVGEVRDREALPLLLTLSSGVTGYTTIHAGNARQALTRLRFICQLADTSSDLSLDALNALVTDAIDLVVHCERSEGTVRISEVIAVEDVQTGKGGVAFTTTSLLVRDHKSGRLDWTGDVPERLGRALERHGHDVRSLLGART